jgi:hypothetical protein
MIISFLEAYLICGDILFDKKDFDESLTNYKLAFAINSLSCHAVKGIVYCYSEIEQFQEAIDFSRDLKFDKMEDPLIFVGLYKACQEVNKMIKSRGVNNEYHETIHENEILCMIFLDYAYKFSKKDLQLLKELSFFYYQLKKYQNVF